MRKLLRAALPFVLLLPAAASAVEIEAGGRTIEIPIPEGYAELTPEMSPMYELMYSYVVPTNERYLIVVPAFAADAFLRGEEAEYDRYMMIEAERQTVRVDITDADFNEFRGLMRVQLDELYDQVRENLPDMFDDASESMSESLDADLSLSVGEVVPFEPHLDTDRAFAYSQLISMGVAVDGEDLGAEVGMATAAFINVRGKLIFVYVYGGEDDLDWSREFASAWLDEIFAANAAPASSSAGADSASSYSDERRDSDGRGIFDGVLIGGLVGAVIGLFSYLLSRRRRKEE